jgi:hypothetical protein
VDDFEVYLLDSKAGDLWELELLREKKVLTISMTIGRRSS